MPKGKYVRGVKTVIVRGEGPDAQRLGTLLRETGKFNILSEGGKVGMLALRRGPKPALCIFDAGLGFTACSRATMGFKRVYGAAKVVIVIPEVDVHTLILRKLAPDGVVRWDDDPARLLGDLRQACLGKCMATDLIFEEAERVQAEHVPGQAAAFLRLCCSQLTYAEIAAKLKLSMRTVDGYRDYFFKRYGVSNRVGLVLYALKHKLVSLDDIKL